MRIDVPSEDDAPRVPPESHAAEAPQSDGCEPSGRVAYAANYPSIVDGTYQDYRAVTSETASLQTHTVHLRGAVDANSGGNCSLTVNETSEMRQTRLVHYRALVEVEYREVRPSQNMNPPALVEASENSETKLLHADADPLRAFGPASETHPAELEAAMVFEAGIASQLEKLKAQRIGQLLGGNDG